VLLVFAKSTFRWPDVHLKSVLQNYFSKDRAALCFSHAAFCFGALREIGTEYCLLWCVCRLTPSGRGGAGFKVDVNYASRTNFHKPLKSNSYTFFTDRFTAMFKTRLNTVNF